MSDAGRTPTDAQWWLAPDWSKHTAVLAVVRRIRQQQEHIKLNDLLNATLYAGRPVTGYGLAVASRIPTLNGRLALNVIRNMVGAVTSKIASKNKPKPTFLTEEGNYEMRTQAENLERFVGGVFYDSGVYSELAQCFRDACVYGTAFLKTYADPTERKVVTKRTKPTEMVVDDLEGKDGEPSNIYQRRYYDRLALIAKAKKWSPSDEHAAEVESALSTPAKRNESDYEDSEFGADTTADLVLVTEAWHLGETPKAKGRHVIVVEGCTLLDEEWTGPFPFAVLRWTQDVEGYFGVGLAEELRGIQAEINKLLQDIQKGHHLIKGHWMVHGKTALSTSLNNDLAAIVRYEGTMPVYQAPTAISPDVYNHLWQLYAKAFEVAGISQLSATGMKPSGLDSGEAQRVYNDIQTERFLEVGQAYEDFVVEAAKHVIRCAKKIGGSYKVPSLGKSDVKFITWSEVNIDEDSYVIRVYPTSLLPSTPAGKLAWAQDMLKSGVLPPEDVLDIVDFPDTEAYAKRKNAARRIIERNIAHMLKTGEPVSPEPFDPHELALRLVNEAYHEARLDGVPEDKLQLLRDYMAVTEKMMPKPPPPPGDMAPPMGPPGAPPMDPMGGPMPPQMMPPPMAA